MMKGNVGRAVAALAVLFASAAVAHHSFSMFDSTKEVVVKGKVVRWSFANPHSMLLLQDSAGAVWAFEGESPGALLTRTPRMLGDTFKTGDELTVVMCPLRDGRKGGATGIVITANGTAYNPSGSGCLAATRRMQQWPVWIKNGFTSLEAAEAAEQKTAP